MTMRKRKMNERHQLSRQELNKRLDDFINNNFRLLSEKSTLQAENKELAETINDLKKESDLTRQMMKLNSIIFILMFQMLNICDETEIDENWGFRRVISDYMSGIVDEMNKFGGSLTPACFGMDYNPIGDNNDEIDLDDYEDSGD